MEAVTQDGLTLRMEICLAAVSQEGMVLQHVPENLREKIKKGIEAVLKTLNILSRWRFSDGRKLIVANIRSWHSCWKN